MKKFIKMLMETIVVVEIGTFSHWLISCSLNASVYVSKNEIYIHQNEVFLLPLLFTLGNFKISLLIIHLSFITLPFSVCLTFSLLFLQVLSLIYALATAATDNKLIPTWGFPFLSIFLFIYTSLQWK